MGRKRETEEVDRDEELESLEDEDDGSDTDDEDSLAPEECALCDAEASIGKKLCETCSHCAICDKAFKGLAKAKKAKVVEDGRICDECFADSYTEDDLIEEEDEEDDEYEEDDE